MKTMVRIITLNKVRLDRGGYDRRGRYFGTGMPVYEAEIVVTSPAGERRTFLVAVRAHDREEAKKLIAADAQSRSKWGWHRL